MRNLFVYEGPHPAHRAWAEAIDCEIPEGATQSKPGIVERWKVKDWYRRASRMAPMVRQTIERTYRDYRPPDHEVDIVLFESWRQTACARHFEGSFRVLIGADWFPFVFHSNARMIRYLEPFELIVSVSDVHSSFIPREVNGNVRIVHPSTHFELGEVGEGRDCSFIGDVFERLKGVDDSVRLFERAFDDGRQFNIIGKCDPRLAGKRRGNVTYWGRVSDQRLRELLKASRYLLHWAVFDPHPVSTMEAMSYGMLPVTSPTTGTHYLTQEVFGDAVDFSSLAVAARQLREFDARGDYEPLRERCRTISRRFTVERSKEEFRAAVMEEYEARGGG